MINPLPIRLGLNPTRAQVPLSSTSAVRASDFLKVLISDQRHRHPEDDDSALDERFARGEVVLDSGEVLRPDSLLLPGMFVNFYRQPAPERPVPGELRVLFSDATLLVVDKPPFLATLPRGQHITETALVKARVQYGIPELSPSHRLDRLTRGVLMFTVRPEIRGAYQTLFDRRLPLKTYEAITDVPEAAPMDPIPRFRHWHSWPEPTPDNPWVLRHHMIKIRGRLSTFLDEDVPASEMNALTKVVGMRTEIRDGREVAVWQLQPGSGKTHQLRVVMRSLGLPILNDPLYADVDDSALLTPNGKLPRPVFVEDEDFTRPMGLIAKRLDFADPLTAEPRSFISQY